MTAQTGYERRWSAKPADRTPHPPPEVFARDASAQDATRSATAWQRKAEAAGWRTRLTYARGTDLHATTGEPTHRVHSLALHMWHQDGEHVADIHWTASAEREPIKYVAAARAWRLGGEWPRPIALAASKDAPERQLLAEYLTKPFPRAVLTPTPAPG